MTFLKTLVTLLGLTLAVAPARAGVCDLVRSPAAVVGGTAAGAVAGAGGALTASGFYATGGNGALVGSTLPGASAAGTVGFVSGSSGLWGGALAVLVDPVVWVPAAVVAVGVGGTYAVCALTDD